MAEDNKLFSVADVTQEVMELRVKNRELGECSFLTDHITDPAVIAKMAHLKCLSEMPEAFWRLPKQKLVFLTDNHFLAKQATLAARSLRGHFMSKIEDQEQEWEQDDLDDLFYDDFFEEDYPEGMPKQQTYPEMHFPGIGEDKNVLLFNPEITILIDGKRMSNGAGGTAEAAGLSLMGQPVNLQETVLLEQASSALVLMCPELQQQEEFLRKIPLLENFDTYLSVLKSQKNEQFLKRLCFEYGFTVIEIGTPSRKHYENVLAQVVKGQLMALGKGLSPSRLVGELRNYRKEDFTEADITIWVARAMEKHFLNKEDLILEAEDFQLYDGVAGQSGVESLDAMIGLKKLKEIVKRTIAVQLAEAAGLCGDKNGKRCLNICFSGRPGVGKTEVARIYAQILGENGVTNGNFICASRDKFVGKYLGQTAPKIAELFEKGRGGVIFVDEAGSLLSDDIYTKEAITEFVRHMENERDTCVIFATYPEEMKRLLAKDPGFSSRIAKVIPFDEYSIEELWEIFLLMADQKSIEVVAECREAVMEYLSALKSEKQEDFGNAREARKLLEASYEFMCLRRGDRLTADDVKSAAGEIGQAPVSRPRMGFTYEAGRNAG